MKKLLIVFIFLLGFTFMPIVNAEEIPREGVTYFLEYPDGSEDIIEDYDEAIAAAEEEKLIFTGQTDENGQVVLENVASEGTLRVVQEVPNGYSTDSREVIINLEESKKVEFKITKGLINPKTGFSILKILLVLAILMICTVLTNKNKKTLLVLPLLLLAGLVNVKADSDNLVIDVKDNLGRAQSGITVKVYAKAKIDAAPAVKYDANGGHFFDGKTEMYVRIPNNGCDAGDFWDSLDENTYNYLEDNIFGAYRERYYPDGTDEPTTLTNGIVIKVVWYQNSNAQLITIHGNGGYLDFYGEKLNNVVIYNRNNNAEVPNVRLSNDSEEAIPARRSYYQMDPYDIAMYFINAGKYNIGLDLVSSCSNYNQYGIIKNDDIYLQIMPNDIYACWHEKPDGIYVNGEAYVASPDNCFYERFLNYGEIDFYSRNYDVMIGNIYSDDSSNPPYVRVAQTVSETSLNIVYHGETVVSMNSNDFTTDTIEMQYYICSRTCSYVPQEEIVSKITNQTKLGQLREYFDIYYNNSICYEPAVPVPGPIYSE